MSMAREMSVRKPSSLGNCGQVCNDEGCGFGDPLDNAVQFSRKSETDNRHRARAPLRQTLARSASPSYAST